MTKINTMDDVREYVAIHSDDDTLDTADLEACFRLVFDRDADDEDRHNGLWSLVCSEVALAVGQRVEGASRTTRIRQINIYRCDGEWCYAAFTSEGFDSSDTLGIDNTATKAEAIREAEQQFPGATVAHVEDVTLEIR